MLGTQPEAVNAFIERVCEVAFECDVSKLFELNSSQEESNEVVEDLGRGL